jgi:ribosomal-protein-alanine N-acetyltransferase
MYQNWASDQEVTKYLTWPAYTSEDDAQKTLKEWISSYQNPAFYQWTIVPKDLSQLPAAESRRLVRSNSHKLG